MKKRDMMKATANEFVRAINRRFRIALCSRSLDKKNSSVTLQLRRAHYPNS